MNDSMKVLGPGKLCIRMCLLAVSILLSPMGLSPAWATGSTTDGGAEAPPSGQSIEPSFIELLSPSGAAGMGYSVSAVGDVNADGHADFLVSTSWVGATTGFATYLYTGSPIGPSVTWQKTDYTQPMKVAAAGDVNGDGYDDALFCFHDPNLFLAGFIEVRYGGPAGFSAGANFTVVGNVNYGASAETAGDVNDDGFDEIIVGEPGAVGGYAYVYMGSSTGLHATDYRRLSAPANAGRFGASVAGIGDVTGDGFGDVIVGAPDAGVVLNGAAYLYWGSSSGLGMDPPANQTIDAGLFGNVDNDLGGVVAPAGDMNGDAYADVIITDPGAGDGFGLHQGVATIYLGSASGLAGGFGGGTGPGDQDFFGGNAFTAGDLNGDGYADVVAAATGSPNEGIILGYVRVLQGRGSPSAIGVATIAGLNTAGTLNARVAGDVNGDGFSDLLVGAPEAGPGLPAVGRARLYYGKADPPHTTPIASRFGNQQEALAGWSVAMGDVNGDGYDDVVVGKPWMNSNGHTKNGAADLYLGGPGGIAATPIWTGTGPTNDAHAGIAVAAGQDINGDGFGDVLVAAHVAEQVRVWFGRYDWQTATDTPDQTVITVDGPGGHFGSSIAFVGDVEGDGYADAVIGAPDLLLGQGAAYYYRGGTAGLTLRGVTLGQQSNMRMGASVAGAGDVDGDGHTDVLVGAPDYDISGSIPNAGMARLYLGTSSGLDFTAPDTQFVGPAANTALGNSVAGIGDVDGDGRGDYAIGAPWVNGVGQVLVRVNGANMFVNGSEANSGFGNSVAPAGDVNGDGYSDLLVGEVFGDGPSLTDCGRATIFLGIALTPISPPFQGTAFFENVGHAIAGGGDVNGDGFGDVALGGPRAASSFFQEGAVKVYLGNSRPAAGAPPSSGRAKPSHPTEICCAGIPVAPYGTGQNPNGIGLTSLTSSPAGRQRARIEWRIQPSPSSTGSSQGVTGWFPLPPPTSVGGGVTQVSFQVGGLNPLSSYAWKLRAQSRSPYFRFGMWSTSQLNGRQWDFHTTGQLDVASRDGASGSLQLSQAWPNPANDIVHLQMALSRAAAVRFEIRDVKGRTVKTIANGELRSGRHAFTWDGRDEQGRSSPPGLYFLDVTAAGERRTGRVALVR